MLTDFQNFSLTDSLVNMQQNLINYPTAPYMCPWTTSWNIRIRK